MSVGIIMKPGRVQAIAVEDMPLVQNGDSIADMILERMELEEGDVIVIASKIVSKSEGRLAKASDVKVSARAKEIAEINSFDPVHVELALREAVEIVRDSGVLITETKTGLVCNFSGVDKSNAPDAEYVLLPESPDDSASRIRDWLTSASGLSLAVIISDTHGRPWRKGSINIAIGCAGINAFKFNIGKKDLHGRVLKRSTVCQIDEIAALVEPVMGQANEKVPVVIVRGYEYSEGKDGASDIVRSKENDMFR
ncbi:MAG: coenzyme F420-0:L-glutamate ligase [Candidatus Thorarchaeota archaeon]|jgi:coenzyme F420-0:L-glutamate ligase/coenzyme F420-1:gamma-L-glutamate ligase